MPSELTIKQENFCLAYIETGNASEAYRQAYNAERMKPEAIHVAACKLLALPKIALRIEVLRAAHAERHDVTVDTIRTMLDADRKLAIKLQKPSAAISATMGLARLYGLLKDKLEVEVNDLAAAIAAGNARIEK